VPAATARAHTPATRLDDARPGDDADSPLEIALARTLALAVRLWCLPALLLLWALTWTAILAIRAAGTLARPR
jgi:hypothetical protein